ncbi:hypothetical protein HHK36_007939 [Tetracentron sinense]|uniref:Uncharacterized protein n=1 Tax=Tetracentron sinense TaxID=13715 RepID=A0A834ZLH4_TETSI|nr:hypothetical protein HHK36_007939 [Tetracentron sinense]
MGQNWVLSKNVGLGTNTISHMASPTIGQCQTRGRDLVYRAILVLRARPMVVINRKASFAEIGRTFAEKNTASLVFVARALQSSNSDLEACRGAQGAPRQVGDNGYRWSCFTWKSRYCIRTLKLWFLPLYLFMVEGLRVLGVYFVLGSPLEL